MSQPRTYAAATSLPRMHVSDFYDLHRSDLSNGHHQLRVHSHHYKAVDFDAGEQVSDARGVT